MGSAERRRGGKLLLCAYHWAGREVLAQVLQRSDIERLFVYTHAAGPGAPDLVPVLEANGVDYTLESINAHPPPFAPDVIASVYYRDVIGAAVLERAALGAFNMHPSLLPRHRGCSSVPWAILEGDRATGVSFHYMDAGIDTGPVILQAVVPIAADETQASLYRRCMETGVAYWPAAFELVLAGFPGVAQADIGASYHSRGAPHDGVIDPTWPLDKVERFIRAMTFPPYPYASFDGREVRTVEEYRSLRAGSPDGDGGQQAATRT